jgi:hypothetical protein
LRNIFLLQIQVFVESRQSQKRALKRAKIVRSMRGVRFILLLAILSAKAQQPAVLENTGHPMLLPFQCTPDDIQSAGMTCSQEEPCPVYLEISSVAAVASRIVLAGNIHSAETTLYSVLLASEDSGRTWREPYPRMRGSGLDHIQLLDSQTGWISGGLLSPLPRDPFLLATTDGGKTWRERPVLSENTGGSILQFWFDAPSSGTLLIDRMQSADASRYELYESPNGGETWNIRQAGNRPIPINSRSAPPVWRVRADSASKSYHIEKLEAERWKSVASFLVPLGVCRPPALAVQPEPVEEPAVPPNPQ